MPEKSGVPAYIPRSSARSADEPSLERHRFAATSSSRTRGAAAHHGPRNAHVPRSCGGSAPCGMTLNSRPLGDNMLHRDDRALRHEPYERVAARLIPSRWPFAMRRAQHGPCRAKIGLFRRFQLLDLMDDHIAGGTGNPSGQRVFVATGTPRRHLGSIARDDVA